MLFHIFAKEAVAGCGHKTLARGNMTAFGVSRKTKISIIDGKTDYCHRCLEKMAIKCAWCGNVIFINDKITLCTPLSKNFEIPEHTVVVHEKNPLKLVGCSRCAEAGADIAGFWHPQLYWKFVHGIWKTSEERVYDCR